MLNNLFLNNELHKLIRIRKQLISNIRIAYDIVIKTKSIKLFDCYEYIKDQISSRKARRYREIDKL